MREGRQGGVETSAQGERLTTEAAVVAEVDTGSAVDSGGGCGAEGTPGGEASGSIMCGLVTSTI